jgi:hypothetical protein
VNLSFKRVRIYAGRMSRLRPVACLAVLLPVLLPVTGCGRVCPAIGWNNTVIVALAGDAGNVAWVQLCSPEACSRATERPTPQPVLPTPTANPTGANGLGFPPGGGPAVHRIVVEKIGADTWRFSFDMDSPGSATVRALDSAGRTLAEQKVPLEWQRTGCTAACGGPATASPVTLAVNT